jgi:hypothetical protein
MPAFSMPAPERPKKITAEVILQAHPMMETMVAQAMAIGREKSRIKAIDAEQKKSDAKERKDKCNAKRLAIGVSRVFTDSMIEQALTRARGKAASAAKDLGCASLTIYKFCRRRGYVTNAASGWRPPVVGPRFSNEEVVSALEAENGDKAAAARRLGCGRSLIFERLKLLEKTSGMKVWVRKMRRVGDTRGRPLVATDDDIERAINRANVGRVKMAAKFAGCSEATVKAYLRRTGRSM